MERGVVIRIGELFLKGRNRPLFEQALADRIKQASASQGPLTVQRGQGRFFLTGGEPEALAETLTTVFGIASVSPVLFVAPELEALAEGCIELARQAQERGAKSFRISSRRADKRFPLVSTQLNAELGARVVVATGLAVDLERPDLNVGVEIGPKRSFVFAETLPGSGGLPVGMAGGGLLLLSGGIDSPVAGHLMQKRGVRLTAVHFHSAPWTSAASQEKVRQLAVRLALRQGSIELHLVPFAPVQERIRDLAEESYRVILYRRMMLRIAQRIAAQRGIQALITGDCLGQVASQTLDNLACVGAATDLLILRPLLGFDKADVVRLARTIGTFEISIQPHDDCCSLFTPRNPRTRGRHSRALKMERQLDGEALVDQALAASTVEVLEEQHRIPVG